MMASTSLFARVNWGRLSFKFGAPELIGRRSRSYRGILMRMNLGRNVPSNKSSGLMCYPAPRCKSLFKCSPTKPMRTPSSRMSGKALSRVCTFCLCILSGTAAADAASLAPDGGIRTSSLQAEFDGAMVSLGMPSPPRTGDPTVPRSRKGAGLPARSRNRAHELRTIDFDPRRSESWTNEFRQAAVRIRAAFGVQVHFSYDAESFFVGGWRKPPCSAKGSQISLDQALLLTPTIELFLSSYPRNIIEHNLRHIYLLGEMSFYGLEYGGTYLADSIYVASNEAKGYSKTDLNGTLHHEFSSILCRNYGFPWTEWAAANEHDWRYAGSGVDLVARFDALQQTEALLKMGLLTVYSQASMEEDVNMYAEYYLGKRAELLSAASKFKRVRQKLIILNRFYKNLGVDIGLRDKSLSESEVKSELPDDVFAPLTSRTIVITLTEGRTYEIRNGATITVKGPTTVTIQGSGPVEIRELP
jgi:hypothetical protein